MRNVGWLKCGFLLLLLIPLVFMSCEEDEKANGSEKGWIKYEGKTYGLSQAAAVSQVESFPGFSGKGYTVRVVSKDRSNDLMFGFYSNASTLQTATGTYTMYRGQPEPGTMSNIVTSGVLGGEPFYWPSFTNIKITIGYSDGKFKIEGYWDSAEGKVEIYYNGEIEIQ